MVTYNYSIQGKSHIERNKPCQDASGIKVIRRGICMAVVADGVGSCKHSDIASKLAVKAAMDYVSENLGKRTDDDIILDCLREAYQFALDTILKHIKKEQGNPADYDTTLHTAIYFKRKIIYGHAGDGGIIIRDRDGVSKVITVPQKGTDGSSVRPLRSGNTSWEFGVYSDVAGVLLATDGMLEGLFSPYLLNLPQNSDEIFVKDRKKENVYPNAVELFLNPYCVREYDCEEFLSGDYKDDKAMRHELNEALSVGYTKLLGKNSAGEIIASAQNNALIWFMKKITDDKSVAVIIDERVPINPKDADYYYEPDWKAIQNKYQNLMYGTETENESQNKKEVAIIKKDESESEEESDEMQGMLKGLIVMVSVLLVITLGSIVYTGISFYRLNLRIENMEANYDELKVHYASQETQSNEESHQENNQENNQETYVEDAADTDYANSDNGYEESSSENGYQPYSEEGVLQNNDDVNEIENIEERENESSVGEERSFSEGIVE